VDTLDALVASNSPDWPILAVLVMFSEQMKQFAGALSGVAKHEPRGH